MDKKLEKSEKKCTKIFAKMDTYNTESSNKSLKKLLKEVNQLKLACQEEVQFIKAQTVSKENSEKLMNEAKERLMALSNRLGQI